MISVNCFLTCPGQAMEVKSVRNNPYLRLTTVTNNVTFAFLASRCDMACRTPLTVAFLLCHDESHPQCAATSRIISPKPLNKPKKRKNNSGAASMVVKTKVTALERSLGIYSDQSTEGALPRKVGNGAVTSARNNNLGVTTLN